MARRVAGFLSLLLTVASARLCAQTATLSGVVRDTTGAPVRGTEVILRDANHATRTNDRGEFTLGDVQPASFSVWFRRLGYRSIEFDWVARSGEKTTLNVVLHQIPRELDPVVVRADEDRNAAARASILGLVVDAEGNAIPEAEVQLVGGNASGLTRANGGFLFKPLAIGTYVLRIRKLGFEPATVTLQLVERDDREVVIRMHPLAANLDPTVVTEKSGYGRAQVAWDELDRRKRWVNFQVRFIGPEDLKSYYGLPLDYAMIRAGMYNPKPSGRAPSHIDPRGTSQRPDLSIPGDACILLNGKDPVMRPLRVYSTDDVELLEVYPSGTELSGTVGWHFNGTQCAPISLFVHPTYYVLWLKDQ